MRLLICGDRNWTNVEAIAREILILQRDNTIECIIEGEAKGADTIARKIAQIMGIPVLRFPANWLQFGKAAGPIRNSQMLREGKPDLVLAFHPNISESKGTRNMIEQAKNAGVFVMIHSK